MPVPKVSVIMVAYNAERTLEEAVRSVLDQTLTDFELLVADDGSADATPRIAADLAGADPRVRVLTHERNLGVSGNRNSALEAARGEYVAMLDSDDVALPDRLARQVAELDARPECGLLSGALWIIDEQSRIIGRRDYPTGDGEIRRVLLRYNPFAQPAAMLRRSVLQRVGRYREDLGVCEDYDLFLRIAAVAEVGNLPDPLIGYRISTAQTKHRRLKETLRNTIDIQVRARREYGLPDSLANRLCRLAQRGLLAAPDRWVFRLYRRFHLNQAAPKGRSIADPPRP